MIPLRIVLHCTDTTDLKSVNIDHIEEDHKARGFGGIGYHAIIQPDGQLVYCRGLNEVGAHVAGHNNGSIGVALAGSKKFTGPQFDRFRSFCQDIFLHYPSVRKWEIYSHAEFDSAIKQGKTCPNIKHKQLLYFVTTGEYSSVIEYRGDLKK